MAKKPKLGDVRYRRKCRGSSYYNYNSSSVEYEIYFFSGGKWYWFMTADHESDAKYERNRLKICLASIIREAREKRDE